MWRLIVLTALFWVVTCFAVCGSLHAMEADHYGPYEAKFMRAVDGDTYEMCLMVYPDVQITTRVRERTVDTPEKGKGAKCEAEKAKAWEAKWFAETELEMAEKITVDEVGHGSFARRMVGKVYVDGVSLGYLLAEHGFAVYYADRDRKPWCDNK